MIARVGTLCSRWAERVVPDPFVFALLLSVLTFFLGWALTPSGAWGMLEAWGTGVWQLLEFAMQMCLILVTGHALAHTRPVRALIDRLASAPRSGRQAAALVALVACLFSLLNWGLGLIVGALAAREVGRRCRERSIPAHYPLLGAAGYMGLLVWHGGLSGSAPLVVATEGHFLAERLAELGWEGGILPVSATLGSARNLIATGGAVVLAVLLCGWLTPDAADCKPAPADSSEPPPSDDEGSGAVELSFARRLERSVWIVAPLGLGGLIYSIAELIRSGGQPNLNVINLCFLSLGLLLHGSASAYAGAVSEAVQGISGIVLQFPFYAGIMGMMRYSGAQTGPSLVQVFASGALEISNESTLPALAYLSAGVVNLFVPSGGGQWAVQGPVLMGATSDAAAVPELVLALSWGDQLTNMLQPFWAIPLLGITRLRARDVMGYTMVVMAFVGLWFLAMTLL